MSSRVKYPRTHHLPWSPGATSDDRIASSEAMEEMSSLPVVITEKMDGGNVTLMRDCFYARSLDSGTPLWEEHAKGRWGQLSHDIPPGWRISAESMWARRSVAYSDLEGYVLVFGVWNEHRDLLSWEETVEWANLLGLPTIPVLGNSIGTSTAEGLWKEHTQGHETEGFVVRYSGAISEEQFPRRVLKWVRANHVRTSAEWRHSTTFETNSCVNAG